MSRRDSGRISHPELELRMNVIGNEYSPYSSYFPEQTSLDILEIYPDGRVMENVDIGHELFTNYCSSLDSKRLAVDKSMDPEPLLRIFFLQDLFIPPFIDINDPDLAPNLITAPNMSDSTAQLLHRHFGVPMLFLQDLIPVITYRTIGNATFIRRNEDGRKISIDGYYQLCSDYTGNKFSYTWFSQSLEKGKASNYVIHKCPTVAKRLVMECAKGPNPVSLTRPFAIDGFLMNDCVMRMNNEMMGPRQHLMKIEHTSVAESWQCPSVQQVGNVALLHDIAREFRLLKDTLYSINDTIDYLVSVIQHTALASAGSAVTVNLDTGSIKESFSVLKSKANWITRELSSLEDRAALKIGLEYTLENQRNSRINLKIASLTGNIAAATHKDSTYMITMAAVTMFFLPGTFVSAIFSMVFFSTSGGEGKFDVAPLWWLFPAITIPLTIVVFLVWIVWRRRRHIRGTKKLADLSMQDVEMSFSEPGFSFAETPVSKAWYRRLSSQLLGRWKSGTASSQVFSNDDNSSFEKKDA